jgi:hypothetical protein
LRLRGAWAAVRAVTQDICPRWSARLPVYGSVTSEEAIMVPEYVVD